MGKCYCCVHENGHLSSGVGGRLNHVRVKTALPFWRRWRAQLSCSETEHRLAGVGGRLSYVERYRTLDVAGVLIWVAKSIGLWIRRGPKSDWVLDCWKAQIELGLGWSTGLVNGSKAQFDFSFYFLLFLSLPARGFASGPFFPFDSFPSLWFFLFFFIFSRTRERDGVAGGR